MPYVVKALRNDEIVSLPVEAESAVAAANYAREGGYAVLGVRRSGIFPQFRSPVGAFSAFQFSRQLIALLSAGLNLMEALHAIASRRGQPGADILAGITKSLNEGYTFATAVERYPAHFSKLYVASVQASARTGTLREALERYVAYEEAMRRVRRTVTSACLYPTFLAGIGSLVLLFLLLYVVPRFSTIYQNFSGDLPLASQILVRVGVFTSHNGALIVATIAAGIFCAVSIARNPSIRRYVIRRAKTAPGIARFFELYQVTRLFRTFSMLLKSGIPVLQSIDMLAPVLNDDAQQKLAHARGLIAEGRAISSAMAQNDLAGPVGERLLLVGERSGDMAVAMDRIALYHEEELKDLIGDFAKLFEPILMALIGILVGAVVVMMYLPLFELATVIQS